MPRLVGDQLFWRADALPMDHFSDLGTRKRSQVPAGPPAYEGNCQHNGAAVRNTETIFREKTVCPAHNQHVGTQDTRRVLRHWADTSWLASLAGNFPPFLGAQRGCCSVMAKQPVEQRRSSHRTQPGRGQGFPELLQTQINPCGRRRAKPARIVNSSVDRSAVSPSLPQGELGFRYT